MRHSELQDLILLDVYGELDEEKSALLRRHLEVCTECQQEQTQIRKFHFLLEKEETVVPENLLWQARQSLFEAVRRESIPKRAARQRRMSEFFSELFRLLRPVPVLTGLALAALGFLGGNLWMQRPGPSAFPAQALVNPFESPEIRIDRVRFEETGESGDSVELSFLASREFRVRGSVEDAHIQRLLAYALLNEANAGVRLQAVNSIQSQGGGRDRDVRVALIGALKTDPNPAVRQQALQALAGYPFHDEIKQALLHVLRYEENARLRIEAINVLSTAVQKGEELEGETVGVLKERIREDRNNYIRSRARDVLRLAGYEQY